MPTITGVSPQAFGDGRSVTVTGSGFGTSGTVTIGGLAQNVTSWTDTTVVFTAVRGTQSIGPAVLDVVGGEILNASLTASGWGQEVTNTGTITGPAPLAVFFDATATSKAGTDTFRLCGYHFDFGYATPTTPGTWEYSGKPKGNQIGGPVAAHVYETPGTYSVGVRAQADDGSYQDRFVTVVVEDPETYWTTGGCTTTTLVRASTTVWPTWANNKRYLLEAGQDYSALGVVNIKDGQNILVTRVGTGADPICSGLRAAYTTGTTPPTAARIVFSGINCLGEASTSTGGTDCLFHACSAKQPHVGTLIEYCYSRNTSVAWARPRRTVFSNCVFDGLNAEMPFMTQAYQLAIIGCSSTNPVEHALRVQGAQYAFIGHSWFHSQGQTGDWRAGSGSKDAVTIRADGLANLSAVASSAETLKPATRYVVVADNLLNDGTETNSSWPLYIGPQNTDTAIESLEYVVAERTRFNGITNSWSGAPVYGAFRCCRQVTIRDDIYLAPGVVSGTGNGGTGGAAPVEWTNGPFFSNTFISAPDNVTSFATPTGILPLRAGT